MYPRRRGAWRLFRGIPLGYQGKPGANEGGERNGEWNIDNDLHHNELAVS